jgi:hypothetical protein
MELLKSQHHVEMENLRCKLEATGRKRRKRLALGGGGEVNTMELEPSLRSDRPQEAVLDDQASSDFAGEKPAQEEEKVHGRLGFHDSYPLFCSISE